MRKKLIVKLFNCFIATTKENNIAIEQYNNSKLRSFTRYRMAPGFTLIELLIVIAVLGILAVGVLIAINVTGNLDKANLAKAKTFAASVENDLSIAQFGKWSFDDQATPGKDTSGYGNNGTLLAGITWKDNDTCKLGFRGCVEFADPNQGIYVGLGGEIPQNGTATFAGWFYFTKSAKTRTPPRHISLYKDLLYQHLNDDNLRICCTLDYFPVASLLTLNKWHHIVFTYSGDTSTAKLYLNTKAFSVTQQGGQHNIDPFGAYIGSNTSNESFYGLIDEVAIYNQALTAYQIRELYAQGWLRHQLAHK